MVRQRQRKSVEELYAPTFDTSPLKPQKNAGLGVGGGGGGGATAKNAPKMRTERLCGDFLIHTTAPRGNAQAGGTAGGGVVAGGVAGSATWRRKTARPPYTAKPSEKYTGKDEKLIIPGDNKNEPRPKAKTTRPSEKMHYGTPVTFDNKNFPDLVGDGPAPPPKEKTPHMHHPHHGCRVQGGAGVGVAFHDEDKDDDAEEFFQIIRQTVESAIGKSISDLLNRNFRELATKVDRFSAELKATNAQLEKLQMELNSKVVHYGEENSRHFRYLCMKSEYDKMFYQHHTMLATTATQLPPPPPPPPQPQSAMPSKRQVRPKKSCATAANMAAPSPMPAQTLPVSEKQSRTCSYRSSKSTSVAGAAGEPHQTTSYEQAMSEKSSEMDMREMLEHIQRFCTRMQQSESKQGKDDYSGIDMYALDDDDDDFQLSSDGMTPRSDAQPPPQYGCSTGAVTMRVSGAGNDGGGDD